MRSDLWNLILLVFLGIIFLRGCWASRQEEERWRNTVQTIGKDTILIRPKFGKPDTTVLNKWDTLYVKSPSDSGIYWKILIGRK